MPGNSALVGRFTEEVINQGRLDVADEIVAVDFVELDPFPGQQQGREGVKPVVAMMRGGFPDIHWVNEETIEEARR